MKDDDENANSLAELLTVIGIDFSIFFSWFHSFVSKLYDDDDDDGYLTLFYNLHIAHEFLELNFLLSIYTENSSIRFVDWDEHLNE